MASVSEISGTEWIDNLKNTKNLINNDYESFTLRVRGGDSNNSKKATNPVGLSRSILHVLRKNPEQWVNVQCVGAKSLFIASVAFQMAASEIESHSRSVRLVNTQWTYAAEIGGKPAKGICMRIFAIPELHAR
jgi:hypothetical protein